MTGPANLQTATAEFTAARDDFLKRRAAIVWGDQEMASLIAKAETWLAAHPDDQDVVIQLRDAKRMRKKHLIRLGAFDRKFRVAEARYRRRGIEIPYTYLGALT